MQGKKKNIKNGLVSAKSHNCTEEQFEKLISNQRGKVYEKA